MGLDLWPVDRGQGLEGSHRVIYGLHRVIKGPYGDYLYYNGVPILGLYRNT